MNKQLEQAQIFLDLHRSGNPLILVNAWDAGSARVVQEAGAQAIATGSWSVAALRRAHAYAEAGAQWIFVPGLCNEKYIESLCRQSPIHVNVMISPESPSLQRLAALGVACISYGPHPYLLMMDALKQASARAITLQEL